MEKSTKIVISVGAIVIIGLVIFLFAAGIFGGAKDTGSKTGTVNDQNNAEFQTATLSIVRGNYVVEPSTLKVGVPVRMTVDMSTVVGCSQDIVIPEFNVRKYVSTSDNIIEFTPTKTGTINMMCSMNMYRGTFNVQ